MAAVAHDAVAARSLHLLQALFGPQLGREVAVRLWDGTSVDAPEPRFTMRVTTPFALRAAFTPPLDLNPGRAVVEGWIELDGDAEAAIDLLDASVKRLSPIEIAKLVAQLARLPGPPRGADGHGAHLRGKRHSKGRDAAAIGFHYDQPLAFYRMFLGAEMVYSCAYWDDGVTDLDAAQRAKLDYVLDKVRLRAGQRFLDIGCGWGGLVIRAAQRGAYATGITLSRRQHEEANRRIAALGLGDLARVELLDYRDVREEYDAIASVGMIEHVGRERYAEYFGTAYRALRGGGLFLNHGIVSQARDGKGFRAGGDFVGRYVFPDGDLANVDTAIRAAENAGFEVRDVENLREHYARTLRAWVRNLESHWDAAVDTTDLSTARIWRLYMAGSARGFARAEMGLMQTLLAKRRPDGGVDIPATRRDLYSPR